MTDEFQAMLESGGSAEKYASIQSLVEQAISNLREEVRTHIVMGSEIGTSLSEKNTLLAGAEGGRLGKWFEFGLSNCINEILNECEIGARCFPVIVDQPFDLEIRRQADGEIVARIEVKCIDARVRESVANFDVHVGATNRGQDCLLVLSWGFSNSESTYGRPVEIGTYALCDAWSYCVIRDQAWFMSGPGGLPKGWDLIGAVVPVEESDLKGEEGNFGKIFRVVKNISKIPGNWDQLPGIGKTLIGLHNEILRWGFDIECDTIAQFYDADTPEFHIREVSGDAVRFAIISPESNGDLTVISGPIASKESRGELHSLLSDEYESVSEVVYLNNQIGNTRFKYSMCSVDPAPSKLIYVPREDAPWHQ